MSRVRALWNVLAASALLAACGVDSEVSRQLGARCEAKEDCEEICLAPGADFPDGFCTLSCMSDEDCPRRAACADTGEGDVCLFRCQENTHCDFLGAGWACESAPRIGQDGTVTVCVGAN